MAAIDLKKTYQAGYRARVGKPALVEVPARPYLMIDGTGDPNTSEGYREAVAALYAFAYGVRAVIKEEMGDAYTVMPLEGLWWSDDMRTFSVDDKGSWKWTMMICQPGPATSEMVEKVILRVMGDKGLAAGEQARFERYGDGLAAQVMHVGPYADEAPTIRLLHDFIESEGLMFTGRHHEIYLGDPRRTDPARLKTIIRQPVTG